MANIYNTARNTLLSGTSDNDTIKNSAGGVTIQSGAGDDSIYNSTFSGYTINGSNGYVTIDAGADNDTICNYNRYVSINGGAGNDEIWNYSGANVTITAGDGDDYIWCGGANVIQYSSGDGNDTIRGFNTTTTLKIGGGYGTYTSQVSGSNILVTVGSGVITLSGAASLASVNIDFEKSDSWKLNGTTATYGSLTVKGVTSLDGLSLNGKVVTVSAESLGTKNISVSDGYTLALGDDVDASTTKKSWSFSGTTATYKQTTTAGYSLVDNTITYSKKSSKTLATVKGVTSLDGLKVNGKTVTVSKASLGTSNVTISDGYTLKLDDDVDASTTKKSWSLSSTTASYKQTTAAGYELVDNSIVYSKKSSKTLATVKGVNDKSGLKVSGKTIKLSGDALSKKVTVSGAYTFDFASDYSKATITGSSSADTIIARGKNILVKGGAGADIFQLKSTGTISDYEESDKISLTSAAEISVSGSDVIFGGKITVAGAANKSVTYIEGGVEKIFKKASDDVKYNSGGTGATLTATYIADEFTPNEYSDFADMLKTIDASAVDYNLTITGNKRANVITGGEEDDFIDGAAGSDKIFGADGNDTLVGGKGNDSLSGGAGNDSLWGGAGSDTLFGGDGSDVFVYKSGDGTIVIEDFDDSWDKIRVLSGDVNSPTVDKAGDVTFAVDDGQIVIKGGADKFIPIYFGKGNKNIVMKHTPR